MVASAANPQSAPIVGPQPRGRACIAATAVNIAAANSPAQPVIAGNRVELQLLTTLQCNLACSYCSLGVGDVLGSQKRATYTAAQLGDFVDKHLADKEIYITLYGGEPAMNPSFALELIDRFPLVRFNMQTNGTLIAKLPDKVLARLVNMMISVDGGEAVTDRYRGKGTCKRVLDNVRAIRNSRTHAVLTARMTGWSGETSIEDFDELLTVFDYVYFQFAQDDQAHPPESVARKKAVLSELVERFFASGETLYPVVPLMGTVRNKVAPQRIDELSAGMTPCRVSTNLLNVMPDGKIYPCPDMLYDRDLLQGDVVGNWVRRSPLQPTPEMPCADCRANAYCRGNCMKNLDLASVKNDVNWRTRVVEPVCDMIRHMGDEIDRFDASAWFARAAQPVRNRLLDAEVYEFCEVMP